MCKAQLQQHLENKNTLNRIAHLKVNYCIYDFLSHVMQNELATCKHGLQLVYRERAPEISHTLMESVQPNPV